MRALSNQHSVEMSDFITQRSSPMSHTRVNVRVRRSGAVLAGALLLLAGSLPLATASPPPNPSQSVVNGCPLERIGTQLVRCDNLTGAGVRAPSWIPEMGSLAVAKRPSDGC
jgi:hypothetical protein